MFMVTSREANFFLPVVFHNLRVYDAHFVIKHFRRQYTKDSKITLDADDNDVAETVTETIYGDVVVAPLNGEKYLSFRWAIEFSGLITVPVDISGKLGRHTL